MNGDWVALPNPRVPSLAERLVTVEFLLHLLQAYYSVDFAKEVKRNLANEEDDEIKVDKNIQKHTHKHRSPYLTNLKSKPHFT
ncbi:hypothetical protein KC19_VG284400 [Ceratodon purpureus]|uniref:Uncharacterized protein n=1 Tax=Ceratodon purpureus TaxID=3225 RepID=A0A8T0HVF3_CERPU|nr:hypothetical protein KC19_VG284400 [Ceratodon purpureus]